MLVLEQLHLLLLQLLLIVPVFLLQLVDLGLHLLHLDHALAVFDVQRQQHHTDEDGEHGDGPAVIADQPVNEIEYRSKQCSHS